MKKRLVIIFFVFFFASFGILNGRFIIENLRFSFFSKLPGTPDLSVAEPVTGLRGIRKTSVDLELYEHLDAAAILFIPKLGITAPIVFDTATDNPSIYKALERGLVNYSLTVKPGEKGTSIILGHSSALPWYPGNYGSVFALLGKLKYGDVFSVQYRDGSTFNFSVRKSLIYNLLNGKENLNNLVSGQEPSIILVSCWPIDLNYKRIAVQAELIQD